MRRGKHYTGVRRVREGVEAWMFGGGRPAALSFDIGLQRNVQRRDLHLRAGPYLNEPLRVAFASDFHAGPCTDPRVLTSAIDAMLGFDPHLVLLGGDFVFHHHKHIAVLAPALSRLRPPLGSYAVLGNHDLWTEDRPIVAALEGAGVRVLINQNVRLPDPFGGVWVCGLDDPGTGDPRPEGALRGADGLRLLLMHSPVGLMVVPPDDFDFALCGHTHGGQIALPGGRPIHLPRGSYKYSSGLFDLGGARKARLLVSKGVGCSDVPVRLFAESEVHTITLEPARHIIR